MFNSGFRGKRANDNQGSNNPQNKFIQTKNPQPYISGYAISGSDDTALDPAGGQTVLINGTGFVSGISAVLAGTQIGSVTLVSPTQISFTTPAKAGGSYSLVVYNSSGGAAILVPGLTYSSVPAYTTAAGSIGSFYETTAISTSVTATSDSSLTYSLSSGSLPSGATLNSNGTITGTSPVDGSSTTYTFDIKATDAELQDVTRTFTLTINTDIVTWSSPSDGTTYTLVGNQAMANVTLSASSAAGYAVSYTANALPTGVTLSSGTISGTPTVAATTNTLLTATSATTNRTATRTVNWVVTLGDAYWKNVSLLLSGSTPTTSFINDVSLNNSQLTIVGDTKPNNFNPYEEGYYSTLITSASGDGGVYLNGQSSFAFGTGDFTIEMWVNLQSVATLQTLIDFRPSGTQGLYPTIYIDTPTNTLRYYTNSADRITGATVFTYGVWHHVAVARSGTSTKLFLDGVQQGSTYTDTNNYIVGASRPYTGYGVSGTGYKMYGGYVSNLRILKQQALYTALFTPPVGPLTAVANTVLLTCQSNSLIDNSPNNYALIIAGTLSVSSANPFTTPTTAAYNTQYSTTFDGTGDYLTLPSNAAYDFGSGDFTLEAWIYPTAIASNRVFVSTQTNGSSSAGWSCFLFSSGYIGFDVYDGSEKYVTASTTQLTAGNWYHVAYTRQSGTLRMFVNGVSQTFSGTQATNVNSATALTIGRQQQAGYTYDFAGNISNVRVVKGTALYTSGFIPSTTPLTTTSQGATASQVSVLTCQDSTLKDNSTNNFTVTSFEQAKPIAVSPFTLTTSNTTVTSLGSAYFDGTGDYLSIPNSAVFNLPGDFTMEAWVYPTSYPGSNNTVMSMWNVGLSFIFKVVAGNRISFYGYPGTTIGVVASSTTVDLNKWSHVAATRVGSTVRLYVNGIQDASTVTMAGTLAGTTDTLTIGSLGTIELWNGYITDARIVKGTATYTSNFLPSQTPLTAVSGTSLLTCQYNGGSSNNGFVDQSSFNNIITRSGNATQGTFSPYSQTGWSTFYNGTTDYQPLPTNAAFAIGTADFTVEAWVMPTGPNLVWSQIFAGVSYGASSDWGLYASDSTTPLYPTFYFTGSGTPGNGATQTQGSQTLTGYTKLTIGQWNHIAVSRASGTARMFINGVQTGPSLNASTWSLANSLQKSIGGGFNGNTNTLFTGYISNLRVVSGTGLYTTTFTPSTVPLTPIAGTILLTNKDNRFVDNSPYNFALTTGGTPSIQALGPFGSVTSSPASYSAYLDGTGYVISPGSGSSNLSPVFGLGNSNYTVELWTWLNNDTSIGIWDFRYQGGGSGLARPNLIYSGGTQILFSIGGTAKITYNVTLSQYTWYHFAVSRISGVTTLYVNGVAQGTYSGTEDFGSANTLTVGTVGDSPGYATTELTGYVSNLRVVRGVGVYTGNFTVPTSPLQLSQSSGTNIAAIGTIPTNGNSVYFDGAGDSLRLVSNTALGMGTGDFTIEFWLYQAAISNYRQILDVSDGNSVGRLILWVDGGGTLYNLGQNGNARHNSAGGAIVLNTWMHVALVRSSGTTKFYINGTQSGSNYTDSTNYTCTTGTMFIGTNEDGSTYSYLGYLSNFRMVKGTAVYTTSFTPSTTPLTAISGTSLLTCQSATLIDNSTNSFVITVSGNSVVSKSWSPFGYNTSFLGFQSYNARDISVNQVTQSVTGNMYVRTTNPFGTNGITSTTLVSYSPSTNGGSMYFDGASDYLRVAANTAYGVMPASGSFTIEGWFYFEDMAISQQIVFTQRDFSSFQYVPYLIWTSGTSIVLYSSSDNGSWNVANNSTIATGIIAKQWYHFAYTRNGSTFRFFVNGTQTYTFTSASAFTNTGTFNIGMSPGETNTALKGYVSDVRFINGVSLYDSNFFPVTTPLTPSVTVSGYTYSSAVFVSGTSGGIVDYHSTNNLETVGNTQLASEDPYSGTYYSVYTNGDDTRLSVPAGTAFNMGSGDFSIEMWVNPTSGSTYGALLAFDAADYPICIYYGSGINGGNIMAAAGTTSAWFTNTQSMTFGTTVTGKWSHILLTRSGDNWRCFQDGVLRYYATQSGTVGDSSGSIYIGANGSSIYRVVASISNLRIIKGSVPTGYQTSSTTTGTTIFTPSTSPLTTTSQGATASQVSLLTCQSNKFIDNSLNGFTVTNLNNGMKVKSMNPFQQNTGKSLYFDGTGDYLTTGQLGSPNLNLVIGDFTIEGWIYNSSPGAERYILSQRGSSSGWELRINSTNLMQFFFTSGSTQTSTATIPSNQWVYIAVTRSANSLSLYINGVLDSTNASFTNGTSAASGYPVYIGNSTSSGGGLFLGYIKDLRITRGVARYSATFTPPTRVLPDR